MLLDDDNTLLERVQAEVEFSNRLSKHYRFIYERNSTNGEHLAVILDNFVYDGKLMSIVVKFPPDYEEGLEKYKQSMLNANMDPSKIIFSSEGNERIHIDVKEIIEGSDFFGSTNDLLYVDPKSLLTDTGTNATR